MQPAALRRAARARRQETTVLLGILALLVLVGVALYANSFSVPFVFDDQLEIVREAKVRELRPLWQYLTEARGVLSLSLALNYRLGELRVWGYHLVNFLVHLTNGLLVYALVLATLRLPFFAGRYQRHARSLALVTSLVFLAHPMQTIAVTYVIQRAESIASLFHLLAVLLFCYAATVASARRRTLAYASTVAATFLGILTKQVAAMIPLTILLYKICFLPFGRERAGRRARWILYGLLFAALASTVAMSWRYMLPKGSPPGRLLNAIFIPTAGFGLEGVTPWQYLLTQFGVVTWYLRLYFWPTQLCLDYGWPLVDSALRLDVVLPFLLLLAIGLAGIFAFRRYRLATFCIGWFFIVLAPTSTLFPLYDAAFEHRMYLPSVGLSWLIVVGAYDAAGWLAQRTGVATLKVWRGLAVAAAAWIATLGGLTIARNEVFRDPLRLTADSAKKAPNHWRPQWEYGRELMVRGRKDEAISAFEEAIRRDPRRAPPRIHLAQIYMERGLLDRAEVHLKEATKVKERSMAAAAFRQLGIIYEARGQRQLARTSFERVARLMPHWEPIRARLARLYELDHDWLEAAQEYDAIMTLNPRSRSMLAQRAASAYYRAGVEEYGSGRKKEAARLLEAATRYGQTNSLGHHYLALAYADLGQWDKAEAAIAAAARVSPDDPAVIENMQRIRGRQQRVPPQETGR